MVGVDRLVVWKLQFNLIEGNGVLQAFRYLFSDIKVFGRNTDLSSLEALVKFFLFHYLPMHIVYRITHEDQNLVFITRNRGKLMLAILQLGQSYVDLRDGRAHIHLLCRQLIH